MAKCCNHMDCMFKASRSDGNVCSTGETWCFDSVVTLFLSAFVMLRGRRPCVDILREDVEEKDVCCVGGSDGADQPENSRVIFYDKISCNLVERGYPSPNPY